MKFRHVCLPTLLLSLALAAGCSQNVETSSDPYLEPPYIEPRYSKTALRVCSDPNNLPFSNEAREGFENKIADVIGEELGLRVEYTWWAQRRGFIRSTLRGFKCDVVIGVPTSFELALTSRPYYKSTYVFVTRNDRQLAITNLDDPILKELTIGAHLIGDDNANVPPLHALNRRGMIENIVGYTIYGDYKEDSPPSRLIKAVEAGEIDVGMAWGPLAGFYARQSRAGLSVVPVKPEIDLPYLPMAYEISLGVRRGEDEYLTLLEGALDRRRDEIDAILKDYGVPNIMTGPPPPRLQNIGGIK